MIISNAYIYFDGSYWTTTQCFYANVENKNERKRNKKYFHRWLSKSKFHTITLTGVRLKQLRYREFVEQRAPVSYLIKTCKLYSIMEAYNSTRSQTKIHLSQDMQWVYIDWEYENPSVGSKKRKFETKKTVVRVMPIAKKRKFDKQIESKKKKFETKKTVVRVMPTAKKRSKNPLHWSDVFGIPFSMEFFDRIANILY